MAVSKLMRIYSWPTFNELAVIMPVLLIIGIPTRQLISLALLTSLFGFASRCVSIKGVPLFRNEFVGFGILISILSFLKGVLPEIQLIWVLPALGLILAGYFLVKKFSNKPKPTAASLVGASLDTKSLLAQALVISGLLYAYGWNSVGPYAASLAVVLLILRRASKRVGQMSTSVILPLGAIFSYSQTRTNTGQFWFSFDQLFRSALADGISTWGIRDHISATGTSISYHWLGEATAGVIGKIIGSTPTDMVTKIFPVIGLTICLAALRQIGSLLNFKSTITSLASFMTILLCNQFDIFSIGSLWGAALFLIGTSASLSNYLQINRSGEANWFSIVLIFLLTPLIIMSQSTLGIYFVCLNLLLSVIVCSYLRKITFNYFILTGLQVLILLILRKTLLDSDSDRVYHPSISFTNFLQFRGLDLYGGTNLFFVIATSVLFLLTLSQMMIGCVLLLHRCKLNYDFNANHFLLALLVTSLLLSNLFSIGGIDAQQFRFMAPIIVAGTFWGLLAILGLLNELLSSSPMQSIRTRIGPAFLLLTASFWGLHYWLDGLGWSYQRTFGIAALTIIVQFSVFILLFLRDRFSSSQFRMTIFTSLLLVVTFIGHNAQIVRQIQFHNMPSDQTRSDLFIGNDNLQDCLQHIRERTPSDSIIASDFLRIPLPTRNEKYFLVSAFAHRRVFVDGPLYIANPRPDWLTERVRISDDFGNRPSPALHEALRRAGVSYFLLGSPELPLSTWEQYATAVFKRDDCTVLRLTS